MIRLFQDGGPFMWVLLFWSIMVFGFFLERLITYIRLRKEGEIAEVTSDLVAHVERGASLDEVMEQCRGLKRLEGEVFGIGVERYEHLSTERRTMEEMRAEMNGTVERASMGYLERYLAVLSFVASTSVLLGLLGTVRGMIVAFRGIAEKGLGEPTIVAAGISEALITTVTGLTIAVPALAAYAYYNGRAEGKAIQFEPYAHLFVDALLRKHEAKEA
ncbi:MAG: MotA/TolQ/ExbB proton channel family protein [Candidatus Latescibacteria bacterium]|nr:MotA/TolQ/ExbB proton channel family protein [Candidatus Latescibacterota bacterium]MCK5380957.1 MotA/TolQ/ExbB proton channel family protein [Candidatus Latescibacterota bacterium]MCK5526262.1 MotA/TolQ/ExbB proton channel family protein [Candidatus Latescibacterota bacterium]MCK5733337.1 MotA/TolQ/ExbB proton channel family protein [Candidatus Latescibacterota bacterium]